MNYALVGRGRMGSAVDRVAREQGHRPVLTVDPDRSRTCGDQGGTQVATLQEADWKEVEVAFEFTRPDAAEGNVAWLLDAGVPVVCGTTGWTPTPELERKCRSAGIAAVIAPNFSIGVNLFLQVARDAARRIGALAASGHSEGYRDWILETHHRGKKDAPSGTAILLAQAVSGADPRRPVVVEGDPAGGVGPDALHVASLRAGYEPGHHVVGFDGPDDQIELHHRLRNRDGLARGAVLAAEWLKGRTGLFDFHAVLSDLLEKGTSR